MAKIAIIPIGVDESPVIPKLAEDSQVHLNIICSDILDFELPPRVENAAPIWHRHELRNVLKQIAPDKFTISSSLRNLLKENDILEMSEIDLGVTAHITQIEQNSKDLIIAYKLLVEDAEMEKLSLIPLVGDHRPLLAFKHKKYAPLRYYYMQEELLDTPPPPPPNNSKRKLNDKKLSIEGADELNELRLSDPAHKALLESHLIVLLPTDLISLGVLVKARELEKQIKSYKSPIVLIWPFSSEEPKDDILIDITKTLDVPYTLNDFAEDLSFLTDYVIINKAEKEHLEALRGEGCNVLLSDFWSEDGKVPDSLIDTLLDVADLSEEIENTTEAEDIADVDSQEELIDEVLKDQDEVTSGKTISQLLESPEEAGIKDKSTKELEKSTPPNGKEQENVMESKTTEKNSQGTKETKSVQEEAQSDEEKKPRDDEDFIFEILEEEDWIDAVKRAIDLGIKQKNGNAVKWLTSQSTKDTDSEMQIADHVVTAWIDARSSTNRKRGAEILAAIAENHRETYLQILQRHMLQTVQQGQDDKRRLLVPLFGILFDVDYALSEAAIKAITKDLASLKEEEPDPVLELAKLTILQLVIPSRRLSRAAIRVLLELLETKNSAGPEIWNTLLAFDAGNVAIELVTNFSIGKVEEIIRRSNLLRFTGSYYSTITKVIQAWKEGDKAAISAATGSILPEETLRKFERLELARKLDKLQMVQLTTLAESLGKDMETVERLVTELIVNDELQAEMKLIDEKMYLVAKKS